jgi:hypothetical protein
MEISMTEEIEQLKNAAIKANIRGDHVAFDKLIKRLHEIWKDKDALAFYAELEKLSIAKGD